MESEKRASEKRRKRLREKKEMRVPHRKTAALSLYSCFFSNYNQLYDSMPYGTFFFNIFILRGQLQTFLEIIPPQHFSIKLIDIDLFWYNIYEIPSS